LPFLQQATGGLLDGNFGRYRGGGINLVDGTIGGGDVWDFGGLAQGGSQLVAKIPGLGTFMGRR
jgi:hypothetical protein